MLVVHGFSWHSAYFEELAAALNTAGKPPPPLARLPHAPACFANVNKFQGANDKGRRLAVWHAQVQCSTSARAKSLSCASPATLCSLVAEGFTEHGIAEIVQNPPGEMSGVEKVDNDRGHRRKVGLLGSVKRHAEGERGRERSKAGEEKRRRTERG